MTEIIMGRKWTRWKKTSTALSIWVEEKDSYVDVHYFGYDGFDNSGGGSWPFYIQIVTDSIASEDAQYKVVITNSSVEVYAADGTQKISDTTSGVWNDFWNYVKSDGSDIRVFNQNLNQLYFWIESWDYTNKQAIIWVRFEAGSSELNIAYGNPSSTMSNYNDPKQTFEWYDDFEDGVVDSTYVPVQGTETVTESGGVLDIVTGTDTAPQGVYINKQLPNDIVVEVDVLEVSTTAANKQFGVYVRYVDANNFYMVRWVDSDTATPVYYKAITLNNAGTYTDLATADSGVDASSGVWYHFKVQVSGSTFNANIAGTSLSVTDSTIASGYVGLFVGWGSGLEFQFDNLKIYKLADPVLFTSVTKQNLAPVKGYDGFDNNGGGAWTQYINIPITTTPSEYAQYKVVIQSDSIEVYAADGTLKASGVGGYDFWQSVKNDGSDIRVFDQTKAQLYFWIETWDYTNQQAIIWVKVLAGTSELNVAYGNPSATKSGYNNPFQVFDIYDDFNDGVISSDWSTVINSAGATVSEANGYLEKSGGSTTIGTETVVLYITRVAPDNFILEVDGYFASGSESSIMFRSSSDGSNGYLFHVYAGGNAVPIIYVKSSGSYTALGSNTYVFPTDSQFHKLKLVVNGSTFTAYIDGNQIEQVTDTTYVSGYIGFRAAIDRYGAWDNIKVYKFADPATFGTPQILMF